MTNTRFTKPLQETDYAAYDEWAEWCNQNNYVIMDDDPEYYYCKSCERTEQEEREYEIRQLKQKLSDTDYQAIKYAEGELSAEEYEAAKALRRTWRARINELEAQ